MCIACQNHNVNPRGASGNPRLSKLNTSKGREHQLPNQHYDKILKGAKSNSPKTAEDNADFIITKGDTITGAWDQKRFYLRCPPVKLIDAIRRP